MLLENGYNKNVIFVRIERWSELIATYSSVDT